MRVGNIGDMVGKYFRNQERVQIMVGPKKFSFFLNRKGSVCVGGYSGYKWQIIL